MKKAPEGAFFIISVTNNLCRMTQFMKTKWLIINHISTIFGTVLGAAA